MTTPEPLWTDEQIKSTASNCTDELDGGVYMYRLFCVSLTAMRDNYEAELATVREENERLKAELEEARQWQPVPHYERQDIFDFSQPPYSKVISLKVEGRIITISDSSGNAISSLLPKEYAVCRATPAPPVPTPDWSEAPEWAQWWVVDASGEWFWHQVEPIMHQTVSACRWDVGCLNGVPQGDLVFGGHIDIPLGIDWRTLKQRRPARTGEPAP